MRINKTIKGESLRYYVQFIVNTMTAEVRFFTSDEPTIGTISDDFKYILLPDNFLSPYIHGHGRIPVGKLKLHRYQQTEAREYNAKL